MKKKLGLLLAALIVMNTASLSYAFESPLKKYSLYDDVMNVQREEIYSQRRQVLDGIDLSSRLNTLSDLISVNDCYNSRGILEIGLDCDYAGIDDKIASEREKSIHFLKVALES